MKKIIMLVVLCCFMLIGCSGGVPDKMNQDTYNIAKEAVEVLQMYNDKKMDSDEAFEKIDDIYNQLDKLKFDDDVQESTNSGIKATLLMCETNITAGDTCLSELNTLKKDLGME